MTTRNIEKLIDVLAELQDKRDKLAQDNAKGNSKRIDHIDREIYKLQTVLLCC